MADPKADSQPDIAGDAADEEWVMLWGAEGASQMSTLEVLGRLSLFELLSEKELKKFEHIVHIRQFEIGETVLRASAPRTGMYVIQSGGADVVRPQRDGSAQVVGNLHVGDLIGEFSLLDDSPRSSAIVASERSTLIGFFRPDLMALIETDPRIGFKILIRLSQMMAEQHRKDMHFLRGLRKQLAAELQIECVNRHAWGGLTFH